MKKLLILVIAGIFISSVGAGAKESSCISCHRSTDWVSDTSVVAAFLAGDIHANMGLGCQDCHGGDPKRGFAEGDPTLAMDPAKGYNPPPGKAGIPDFCARCHSDIEYMKRFNPRLPTNQLDLYKTSVHGKRIFDAKDTKAAVCIDCHGTHGILPASDSRSPVYHQNVPGTCKKCHSDAVYMTGYEYKGKPLPADQFDEYVRSVHGILVLEKGDQAAPACNNCHGNHGASPPNLASVSAACGECHANNRDFFNASPHQAAFKELGYPECEQCHGNHLILAATDTLLGVTPGALCIECHDQGTAGYQAAAQMKAAVDSLRMAIATAESTLSVAEQKGVEGGQARFDLGPAKDNLTRVRSVVHTVDPAQITELTSSGMKTAESVRLTATAALGDIKIRQIGLGVSLLLVIFMAYALWRKITQVDKDTDFEVKR